MPRVWKSEVQHKTKSNLFPLSQMILWIDVKSLQGYCSCNFGFMDLYIININRSMIEPINKIQINKNEDFALSTYEYTREARSTININ